MSSSGIFSIVQASALLGVLFHFAIIKIEFEQYMYHYIIAGASAFCAISYGMVFHGGIAPITAFFQACISLISFNVGLVTSMVVYRLFFHRCRKYPGPVFAKLSRFYATYLSAKDMQFCNELHKLHEKYGDIVRTGPREISIRDKAAIPVIYGPNSECRKSTWYGQSGNDSRKVSINMTRNNKEYRLRRRAWDRGFSTKALLTYEPRVRAKVDLFIKQLTAFNGSPIDVTKWSMLFSFDIMGEMGFGKDFSGLSTGKEHLAIKGMHEHIAILGVLSTVPWLLNLLGSIPGAAAGFSEFFSVCSREIDEKEKAWDDQKYPQDIVSWLLKAIKDKDISASPTPESLADDSRVMIIAGSDTTAIALANALFFLAKYPSVQQKLRKILAVAVPAGYMSSTYEQIKTVTYLDDVINETLRLKPPIIPGTSRETPAQGICVGDVHIPGNVNVSVPCLGIQRDPRWWQKANEFIPERFGERRQEMKTDDAPFFPFQLGMHSCIGKNLAFLTLRTVLSAIVQNFDIALAPGETGENFDERFQDVLAMGLPPLSLQFVDRGT